MPPNDAARSIPSDRFERLIEVATRTFIAKGYRQTQMADVAEALGVAELPIETPAPGVTVGRLEARIAEEAADLRLVTLFRSNLHAM